MEVTLKNTEEGIDLSVTGRIDTNTAEEFEKALLSAIEQTDFVRIDFAEVEYISSAGLRALLTGQKRVNEGDKEMVCANINDEVESVFSVTGFMNVLTVE